MPRRHITLPGDLFDEIDAYRFDNRIATRTEAIHRLIRAGLEAEAPFDADTLTVTPGPALPHDQFSTAMKEKRPRRLEKSLSGSPTRHR